MNPRNSMADQTPNQPQPQSPEPQPPQPDPALPDPAVNAPQFDLLTEGYDPAKIIKR
jgi:hypothetical protein